MNATALDSQLVSEDSPRFDVGRIYAETGRLLVTPKMLERPKAYGLQGADLDALNQTREWLESFIMRQVEKAPGKTEAVCPFVRPAFDANLFFMSVARPENPNSLEDMQNELRRYRDIFKQIRPDEPPTSWLRAILVLFPETDGPNILKAVDLKNSSVKTELMSSDVMIGEFYDECPFAATWDEGIFPLQSPVPMYAVRTFIESDWRFIHREPQWREIYKARYGAPPEGEDYYTMTNRIKTLLGKVARKSGLQK